MAHIIGSLIRSYHKLNDEWSDQKTNTWFLMSNPFPIAIILAIYVYYSTDIGPRYMKNRTPVNIKNIMLVYNAAQVVTNLHLLIKIVTTCLWLINWRCAPVDHSNSDSAHAVAGLVHHYFLIKVVDLLDTVFFVIRKKNNQITFLHMYHHTGMVVLAWLGTKYFPGGQGIFIGALNCGVHAVMYTYYFYTSWNSEYKKSIWWKKYLTQLQLIQFITVFIHQLQPLILPDCGFPQWISFLLSIQNTFLMIIFMDFYIKTYVKKKDIE